MTANERDSIVAVVHGSFSEGGNSILSAFSWEPLRAKLQDRMCTCVHTQPAAKFFKIHVK